MCEKRERDTRPVSGGGRSGEASRGVDDAVVLVLAPLVGRAPRLFSLPLPHDLRLETRHQHPAACQGRKSTDSSLNISQTPCIQENSLVAEFVVAGLPAQLVDHLLQLPIPQGNSRFLQERWRCKE